MLWNSILYIARPTLALWEMGQAYGKLGTRFRKQEGDAYSRIVRDYPLSDYADDATAKLKELEMPVPEADKAAVARMQYEVDHKEKARLKVRGTQWIKRGPDMSAAAHQGDPAMTNLRPSVPPLVPQPAGAGGGFNGEVTATSRRELHRAGYQTGRARQSAASRRRLHPPASPRRRCRCQARRGSAGQRLTRTPRRKRRRTKSSPAADPQQLITGSRSQPAAHTGCATPPAAPPAAASHKC
jgi:hypothetical protein